MATSIAKNSKINLENRICNVLTSLYFSIYGDYQYHDFDYGSTDPWYHVKISLHVCCVFMALWVCCVSDYASCISLEYRVQPVARIPLPIQWRQVLIAIKFVLKSELLYISYCSYGKQVVNKLLSHVVRKY